MTRGVGIVTITSSPTCCASVYAGRARATPELHCRASAWFERQDLVQEAIEHALAAADWQRATRLIVQSRRRSSFVDSFTRHSPG